MCPPYPDCIEPWVGFQNTTSCTSVGDINFDSTTNVLDIILLVSFILDSSSPDYQEFVASDFNLDGSLNVLDVVGIVDLILGSS